MRITRSATALLLASGLALAGCSTAPGPAASAGGGMMGGGTAAPVQGFIAVARDAAMSPPVFDLASGTIGIGRVLAPADGWAVVRSTEAPGGVLGAVRVRAGENRHVSVPLRVSDGRTMRVAIHGDRGAPGTFEFDPDRPELSLDKPIVVDGAALELPATLKGWGVDALPSTAILLVEDQKAAAQVVVAYLLVPAASWVEVRAVKDGVPGRVLGRVSRAAGESHRIAVPISGAAAGDEVVVTVLADRGAIGKYEPARPGVLDAPDQPWVDSGVAVSLRVTLR